MTSLHNRALRTSLGVAAVYAVIGGLWILLSDRVLLILFPDPDRYAALQTWKGWFYVLVTTLLLFALIRRALLELGRTQEELRLREEALRQAQKMEAVGRLAGGVAHDFNNILMVIQGYTEVLQEQIGTDDPRGQDLAQIRSATDRAALLTRQLLTFSRRRPLRPETLDLREAVEAGERMLRRVIGEDVEISVQSTGQPCWIEVDPVQIEQILLNLALNARDAMPSGGELRLRVRRLPAALVDEPLHRGEHVVLEVEDDGEGMAEEVQEHAFEPFFTTKETGKGTGLGLSTVYGIMEQAGGRVDLQSAVGMGTTFRLLFPLAAPARPAAPPGDPDAGRRGAGELILLAEDETEVGDLLERILLAEGYRVLRAADGEAALAAVRGREDELDLVLTDLVMPRLDGARLAARLHARRPELPVLYLSGYAEREALDPRVRSDPRHFLEKPVEPAEVLRRVRERLDGAPA